MSSHKVLNHLFYRTRARSVVRQRARPLVFDPFYLHLSRLKRTFEEAAGAAAIRSVLDLGCGGRHYARLLGDRDIQYVGVDNLGDAEEIIKLDLEEDFSLGTYDLVICSEVLEHVFNYPRLIDNMFKHVAPGGVLFVTVPFAHEIHGWAYHDYFRFTDQALRLLFGRSGQARIQPTNSYLSSIVQRFNNLVFYVPVPFFFKVPVFLILNLFMIGIEGATRATLRVLRIGPDRPFYRLLYSYPLGYTCLVRPCSPETTDRADGHE